MLTDQRKAVSRMTDEDLATLNSPQRRFMEGLLTVSKKEAQQAGDHEFLALIEVKLKALRSAGEHREGLNLVPIRPIIQGMLGQTDSRALKIAKTRTAKRRRPPEVQAIYDAGLTPNGAAELCGTTRDVLKQAWAKGSQFREIRPEWKKVLAKAGIPETVWRTRG